MRPPVYSHLIMQTTECRSLAALCGKAPLVPHTITRRRCADNDVLISIKFAGVCHSDIHNAREEWATTSIFPMVPGHEIVGHVAQIGPAVTKFNVGDTVGVGVFVDSCRSCQACKAGDDNYCSGGLVPTYNSRAKHPHMPEYNKSGGAPTYGGYSKSIVVDESYVLAVPTNLDLAACAPLLCAGVTTFSPLVHFGLKPVHKFAVMGLGGLGHMGVKFGVAFGAHTTVISRGTKKRESALNDLKADAFIDSTDPEAMKAAACEFDFILNTVAAKHDIESYLGLLKVDGRMVVVGLPDEPLSLDMRPLIVKRRTISGSVIGSIKETQEMLDFCGRHNITCDIELISGDKVNEAWDRTVAGDVKYRFVIDTASI